MNPFQHLAKFRDTAKAVYEQYDGLYNELCNVADLLNTEEVPLQLPWTKGELELREHGGAVVRWLVRGAPIITVAVTPDAPGRRVWGHGYYTSAPYYAERTQPTPPAEWRAFVRQIYP